MFPVDTFQAQYLEEREAAEIAKRLAKLQQEQQRAQMANVSAKVAAERDSSMSRSSSQQPRSLGQALLQRPTLSRAASQTVLGNIFQGFAARSSSQPPLCTKDSVSGTSTPARTPLLTPTKTMTQAEMEAAMVAEKKRDADICAMPAWYH